MRRDKYIAPEIEIASFDVNRSIMNASDGNGGEFDGDKETFKPEDSTVDIETFPFG